MNIDFKEYLNQIDTWFKENGLKCIIAIITLILGILIIKLLMLLIRRSVKKIKNIEQISVSFICSIIKILLYITLLFIVSQIVGIPTSGFVALFSIVSLACTLALQDSLSNLFNGMIIISSKPFRTGEYILINGNEGRVKAINTMYTSLITNDGKEIIIPNSLIVKNEIINYDRVGKRRLDMNFDVGYASDVSLVKKIITKVINEDPRVLKDESISVVLSTFNDNNITFTSKCWVKTEDYWNLKFDLNELIFNEFKRNKINIDYNQVEVRLRNDEVKESILDYSSLDRSSKVKDDDNKDFIEKIEYQIDKKEKEKRLKKSKNKK